MSTVYIVFGQHGEYSDRTDWPVAAYFDKQMAEQHAEAAEADARVLGLRMRKEYDALPTENTGGYESKRVNEHTALMKRHDEQRASRWYDPTDHGADLWDSTSYYVMEAELRDSLPSIEAPMPRLGRS